MPKKPEEVWLIPELETSRRCSWVKRMSVESDAPSVQIMVRAHQWMRIGQGNWKRCARRRATFELVGE